MRINEILNELLAQYNYIEYINEVKSGKEASVHLVKADGTLYALKVYKENQKYSSKSDYMQIGEIGSSRIARAVKKKSRTGIKEMTSMWTTREFKVMRMLSDLTENVPKVFQHGNDYILMEWIGINTNSAPRLNEVNLTTGEATKCFNTVIECIELFIKNDFVHGDLSVYNILWHNNHPVIIDFPQILNISRNTNAYEKLKKDLENIEKYFRKLNIEGLDTKLNRIIDLFHQKRIYG